MSGIIGIDLGTTNSLVATVDSGIPYVIADADGRRLTPSVVSFTGHPPGITVGLAAQRLRVTQPQSTYYSIKRYIGRRRAEIAGDQARVPFALETGEDGGVVFPQGDRRLRPEDISAEVLKRLKQIAGADLGHEVNRAVITVPAYFNNAQRDATKRAGELAGFTVERILNEPTAAALAYGLDRLKEKSKIAVYDLGGGTFDLSILELNEGVFQVLATNGNTRLGGDDIDAALGRLLAERITTDGGPDVTTDATWQARVREAAETAKIQLSESTEARVTLPFLRPDFSFEGVVTRAELERVARPIVERTREHCVRSLADAKLAAGDLQQVILVGGQTRMPLVRRLAAEWFGCAEFAESRGQLRVGEGFHTADGPVLNTSQNPDEAVALGAAIQGAILAGGIRNILLLDVTPLSLGIETFGGLMNVIIPRNTTIPTKAGEAFTTAVDHQREMLIHVLQGERERARDNWSLGRFAIEFERARRGVPRVGVQFEIDADGILHVLARDLQTGREKIVDLKSAVDVEDARVQQMVEESVEHAFDDLRARRWIEARLKAEETLAAAESGLAECGAQLATVNRQEIESATASVRQILAAGEATGSGSPEQLQTAQAQLDEVTQPLAELLMEKAVEAMLHRRELVR